MDHSTKMGQLTKLQTKVIDTYQKYAAFFSNSALVLEWPVSALSVVTSPWGSMTSCWTNGMLSKQSGCCVLFQLDRSWLRYVEWRCIEYLITTLVIYIFINYTLLCMEFLLPTDVIKIITLKRVWKHTGAIYFIVWIDCLDTTQRININT